MDSEATVHICNDPKWLLNLIDPLNEDLHLYFVDGKKVKIEAFGDVYLKFDLGSFIIKRIACATKLNVNVMSVAKVDDEGCKILLDDHITIIRENIILCIERKLQGLFELFLEPFGPKTDTTTILELERIVNKVKEDKIAIM